jgi:hypothetical protein
MLALPLHSQRRRRAGSLAARDRPPVVIARRRPGLTRPLPAALDHPLAIPRVPPNEPPLPRRRPRTPGRRPATAGTSPLSELPARHPNTRTAHRTQHSPQRRRQRPSKSSSRERSQPRHAPGRRPRSEHGLTLFVVSVCVGTYPAALGRGPALLTAHGREVGVATETLLTKADQVSDDPGRAPPDYALTARACCRPGRHLRRMGAGMTAVRMRQRATTTPLLGLARWVLPAGRRDRLCCAGFVSEDWAAAITTADGSAGRDRPARSPARRRAPAATAVRTSDSRPACQRAVAGTPPLTADRRSRTGRAVRTEN